MVVCHPHHDTSARAAAHRAMAILALQSNSSLKVRYRRYNAHTRKASALSRLAETTSQQHQEVES